MVLSRICGLHFLLLMVLIYTSRPSIVSGLKCTSCEQDCSNPTVTTCKEDVPYVCVAHKVDGDHRKSCLKKDTVGDLDPACYCETDECNKDIEPDECDANSVNDNEDGSHNNGSSPHPPTTTTTTTTTKNSSPSSSSTAGAGGGNPGEPDMTTPSAGGGGTEKLNRNVGLLVAMAALSTSFLVQLSQQWTS